MGGGGGGGSLPFFKGVNAFFFPILELMEADLLSSRLQLVHMYTHNKTEEVTWTASYVILRHQISPMRFENKKALKLAATREIVKQD